MESPHPQRKWDPLATPTTVITDLTFPEGLRWHAGALWFSDMHDHSVWRWHDGALERVAQLPGPCSGLGFLDAATLLVASQEDRRVVAVHLVTGAQRTHSDLSAIATWHINDLLTDATGRAYVGNYGGEPDLSRPVDPGVLAGIAPDGTAYAAADGLLFANGMALLDGGHTLVVAETRAQPGRLTAFTVAADGSLHDRRVHHQFTDQWPDGLAVDAQDAVWVACPFSDEVLRVDRCGEVVGRVAVSSPYAVALGGPDGRDLFIGSSPTWLPQEAAARRAGVIVQVRVRVGAW